MSSLQKNGTEQFVMQVIRNAPQACFSFGVLVFDNRRNGYLPELEGRGVEVWQLPPRRAGARRYHAALDNFFREHAVDFDAVHFHAGSLTTLAPLSAARRYGVKIRILHIHSSGCTGLHNHILHRLNRLRVMHEATHLLACSREAARWGFGKNSKAFVIANGIDVSRFIFDSVCRRSTREMFGFARTTKVLLHVGSFNRIKNQSFLLPVINEVRRLNPDAVLLLAGDGALLETVKEEALRLGAGQHVRFLGRREDVSELLQAADVMLLPSLSEGEPYVLLEAYAASLPVVVSSSVKLDRELAGVMSLPIDNPELWAVKALEFSGQQRAELSSEERDKISVEATVGNLCRVYSRCLDSSEP